MHPARIIHRNIDTAMHRLATAEKIAPNVIDDITYRKQLVGTRNTDNGRGSKGGHSDPTANAAAERAALEDKTTRIVEASRIVLAAIDRLDEACRDGLGRALVTADNADRCIGYPVGHDCGALVGYRIADSGMIRLDELGLCHTCRRESDADERRARDAERKRRART